MLIFYLQSFFFLLSRPFKVEKCLYRWWLYDWRGVDFQ